MPTPIDLEEAGRLLGPNNKPWSLNRVERLIAHGHLPCYGRGAARVTFVEAVEAFQQAVLDGRVQWPPKRDAAPVAPACTPKTTSKKPRPLPLPSGVEPLRAKPPKRN